MIQTPTLFAVSTLAVALQPIQTCDERLNMPFLDMTKMLGRYVFLGGSLLRDLIRGLLSYRRPVCRWGSIEWCDLGCPLSRLVIPSR
ncbi:hypothetical protein F4802DRAFT_574283 [Xylaria palmicola]|nr:hypothetical protein F4802DRAFT_574283 [Xylaria palmicola]